MVTRGCGDRVENGLYLTVPTSPYGRPLEAFLIDPAIPWGGGSLRAPMLVPDPAGVNHVLLGIGAENYPYFPDFFEEAKAFGVSKRIPLSFDPSRLIPGKSKFLLMHPRGIAFFEWEATRKYCNVKARKDALSREPRDELEHECVGGLWALSCFGDNQKHVVKAYDLERASIETPSVEYKVSLPKKPQYRFKTAKKKVTTRADTHKYNPGILLGFAYFTFQYVNKKGEIPKEVVDRFGTRFTLEVVPE